MKAKPLISVIIPLYNYQQYIEACVRSVLAQTYENLQIIVVNNGSTDDSREKVAAISDSRLELYDIVKNDGWPPALNLGYTHARGEWIQIFTADDTLQPTFHERLMEVAASDPCDLVGCWILPVDHNGVPTPEVTALHDATNYHDFNWKDFREFAWTQRLQGNSFLWKASLFKKIMPAPNVIPADWVLVHRALREKITARIVPERLLNYRWHGANTGATMQVIGYRLQLAYVHMTEYRVTALLLAEDPIAELKLIKRQFQTQVLSLFAQHPDKVARLLIASEYDSTVRERWPTFEIFQDWLNEPVPADDNVYNALGSAAERLVSATASEHAALSRADRLRAELDRTKIRAERLREELDGSKKRSKEKRK